MMPDLPAGPEEAPRALPYRLRWRPRGARPGAHPAAGEGGEGTFRGLAPLLARPDPRRIDIAALARDPFEAVQVRSFAPRRAVTVAVLADVSASMGFDGLAREVAHLVGCLAASALAQGDAFTLAAADSEVREDLHLPPGRRRALPREAAAAIAGASFRGRGAQGLLAAAERLPRQRGLVFLVSDFLMPNKDIDAILEALWRHDVVPIVVRDSRAEGALPAFGLMEARDAETGARRLLLLRPALRARWQAAARARLEALDALFTRQGLLPFHLIDRFEADALADFLAHR